jgi:hypothetical protein
LTVAGSDALQAGPGSTGRVGAAGLLESQSHGVFGLPGVSLAGSASETVVGSVVTSSGKSVHLDQGTRLLLTSTAGSSASTAPQAARSPDEHPRRPPAPPTEKPKP